MIAITYIPPTPERPVPPPPDQVLRRLPADVLAALEAAAEELELCGACENGRALYLLRRILEEQ